MGKFFKKEENQPFTYPSIIEHRERSSSMKWFIGGVLLTTIVLVAYILLK